MDRLHIRWDGPHHTRDDTSLLCDALGIADDEGPIILVPSRKRKGPVSKGALAYGAQVFENLPWLVSHLIEYGEELNCEFMLGICKSVPHARLDLAISGLCRIRQFLNETAGFARKRRLTGPAGQQARRMAEMTHGTVSAAPIQQFSLVVENGGDAYEDVAKSFPDLMPTIMLLAS